jgi:hypothetical protein
MALQPQPAFTVDASVGMPVGQSSSRIALPGTPASDTVVRIANMGTAPVAVALGNNSVVATNQNLVVLAGQVQYLAINSNTYLAAICCGGNNSTLNISTGN